MEQHFSSRRASRYGLVVALLALGFAALSVGPALARSSPATPFRSDVSGTVVTTGPGGFSLSGSGQSISLGRTGYAGSVQITSTDSNGVITDVMTETLTAANGDTLTLQCDQTATPVSPGVLHGTDHWTVIGGTGRFTNASGSGTGSTDADLNVGTFSKTSSGRIQYG